MGKGIKEMYDHMILLPLHGKGKIHMWNSSKEYAIDW